MADDDGAPTSYQALAEGTPVRSSDGEQVGVVTHVLADVEDDIFDGLVIDSRLGPGGHRFVDAPDVARLYERAVILRLDAAACERLPEPSGNPAAMGVDPGAAVEEGLQHKLRRAWDLISGKY